jgi:hypothetical protein
VRRLSCLTEIAGGIAPSQRGIDGKPPLDFEYVRL